MSSVAIALIFLLYAMVGLTALAAMVVAPVYILYRLGVYGSSIVQRRAAALRATPAERLRGSFASSTRWGR